MINLTNFITLTINLLLLINTANSLDCDRLCNDVNENHLEFRLSDINYNRRFDYVYNVDYITHTNYYYKVVNSSMCYFYCENYKEILFLYNEGHYKINQIYNNEPTHTSIYSTTTDELNGSSTLTFIAKNTTVGTTTVSTTTTSSLMTTTTVTVSTITTTTNVRTTTVGTTTSTSDIQTPTNVPVDRNISNNTTVISGIDNRILFISFVGIVFVLIIIIFAISRNNRNKRRIEAIDDNTSYAFTEYDNVNTMLSNNMTDNLYVNPLYINHEESLSDYESDVNNN